MMAINREAVVASAEKLVARGKIDGAIKEYRKLVADNPNDAMTLNRLGDLYVRVNKIEEAVKLFAQIADRYTDDGFFVKAIAIFKKIIKLDPTRLPVYERLAELYHKQGLVSEARTQYQVLVDYYMKHDKVESAENVLRQMTALDSGDPSPHVKLAEIYRERGEHEREMQEYRVLAEMMLRHGRIEEATKVYARAIALEPQDLGFITDAVLGLKDGGHFAAAAKLLATAVEKNPQAEKIARIAGLTKDRRESSGTHPQPDAPRVLKVSDIASAPPELRDAITPPPSALRPGVGGSGVATPRPDLTASTSGISRPRIDVDERELLPPLPDDDVTASGVTSIPGSRVRRPTFGVPSGEPPVAASAPAESAADEARDVYEISDVEAELEIELEIEGFEGEAPAAPAQASEEPAATEEVLDWEFEPEPDLVLDLELPSTGSPAEAVEELFAETEEAAQEPASSPAPSTPQAPPVEEVAVAAPQPPLVEVPLARRLGDLLAEAEVFRKYGLGEKAHDRVREILREDPEHAGALALGVQLAIDEGKLERALIRAQELEKLAAERPAVADVWSSLRGRLEKAGFTFSGERLTAAPAQRTVAKDSVSRLLDELTGVAKPDKPIRPAGKPAGGDLSALVDGLLASTRPKPTAPKAELPLPELPPEILRAAAPPVPPPPIEAVEPAPAPTVEATTPTPEPPAHEELEVAIEDRLSWLDEAAARVQAPKSAAARGDAPAIDDALFDEEEGFFDLAAELEEELTKEEIVSGREVLPREEPSLEEIVEGFKKGVAESLAPEDYDTHFNLGIAYREMGLLDEAIGEFQLAAKHPNYLLDCCSLLGGCFLEKGLPELAIKWYQKGLSTPELSEDGRLGLLYDLGNLFVTSGDTDKARRTFVEIYGINSNYRDTVAILEELGAR